MPLDKINTFEAEIIGGIFSSHGDAEGVDKPGVRLDVPGDTTQVIFHPDDKPAREAFTEALVEAIHSGSIRVSSKDGTKSLPMIEVVDNLETENNSDASCRTDQLNLAY